ncbi:MAG: CBS domain-containing protein [Alphaproteobacteria bacterium]|nr:CBS domain-containing protein [Alphaproteobacteria bacterium]
MPAVVTEARLNALDGWSMEAKVQVRELMTRSVTVASPEDTLKTAARKMVEAGCGILPVGENDRLIGMLSDRDIVVRAVAEGLDPASCPVRAVMSPDVKYCYEDESTDDLARNMATLQVKRLPVLDRHKRLVGIVSLGDMAIEPGAKEEAKDALAGISQPS